mmetsp:Transcript_2905/g.9996  ORF Transcript_2905/g.9996 Transcript_2905/m.9996 type:complete len:202 (-) Transcript_2905:300-905(-)
MLKLINVLPGSYVDDRRVRRGHRAQRPSALGVAVELGHDHRPHRHRLLERQGLVVRGLAHRPVDHENDAVRLHRLLDLPHLLEQGVLLLVPTAGVHDDQVVLLLAKAVHAGLRDGRGVRLGVRPVKWDPRLGTVLLQLVEGSGAKGVRADHGRPVSLALVRVRVLGARRRLTVTLKPDKHNHVALSLFQLVGLRGRVQHGT